MTKINSNSKGKVGEPEFATLMRKHGYKVRRSIQYNGMCGTSDLSTNPGLYVAVKFRESLNAYTEYIKTRAEMQITEPEKVALLSHRRKNHTRWLVTLCADDFFNLISKQEVTKNG